MELEGKGERGAGLQAVSFERDIFIQSGFMQHGTLNPAGTPPHAKYVDGSLISSPSSIKIVLIDLIRHDHHPEQKHRPDDIEREHRLPVLADALRLQPGERRLAVGEAAAGPVEVAVVIHGTGGPVELDGGFDEAGQEEDEEDEGA